MISPRLARRIAQVHKWLGLVVGLQLLIWTASGLFFAAVRLSDVRGETLVHPSVQMQPIDMRSVKLTSADALRAVAEDAPLEVTLKGLGGEPVYVVRGEIGVFLVSAESGDKIDIDENRARRIAREAWAGQGGVASLRLLDKAPRESGLKGEAWKVEFVGEGHPTLYVSTLDGRVSPPRTDLWRTYDFLYGLHLMDYAEHENANTPWMVAAAILAVTTVLFGVALLVHRFSRAASGGRAP